MTIALWCTLLIDYMYLKIDIFQDIRCRPYISKLGRDSLKVTVNGEVNLGTEVWLTEI